MARGERGLPVAQRRSRWTGRPLPATRAVAVPAAVQTAAQQSGPAPSEGDYQALFRESALGMHLVDLQGRLVESNPAFQHLVGYGSAELAGMPLTQLMHPDDRGRDAELQHELLAGTRPAYQRELRYRGKTGQTLWVRVSVSLVHDAAGVPRYTVGMVEAIGARKRREEALTYHAYYDVVTALPNRLLFQDRLGQTLRAAQRGDPGFAVLVLDLDDFKRLNDTLGHRAGDMVLRQVASRLRGSVRDADTVARLGGDEFVILLPSADAGAALGGATRILRTLLDPFVVDGQRWPIGASIGASVYPLHGADGGTLLHHADQAMYAAKRSHRGYVLYDAPLPPTVTRREAS